jgi:uncharacterized protein with von Willebrand factor type A (vWA) domain
VTQAALADVKVLHKGLQVDLLECSNKVMNKLYSLTDSQSKTLHSLKAINKQTEELRASTENTHNQVGQVLIE